jgi:adenine nucleotide transporter 17
VSNLQVIKSVYADYGIPGFWNGCGASLIMVVNPTIQYAIYEWLMARTQRRNRRAPSTLHVFFCSSVAKAGATLLTYPMLTIKTRMMSARRDQQYRGVGDAVRSIYRREGIRGYFQGIETKILQSILGASVLLMIKEKITMGVKARLLLAGR